MDLERRKGRRRLFALVTSALVSLSTFAPTVAWALDIQKPGH